MLPIISYNFKYVFVCFLGLKVKTFKLFEYEWFLDSCAMHIFI